jgi:hypothetical protein
MWEALAAPGGQVKIKGFTFENQSTRRQQWIYRGVHRGAHPGLLALVDWGARGVQNNQIQKYGTRFFLF